MCYGVAIHMSNITTELEFQIGDKLFYENEVPVNVVSIHINKQGVLYTGEDLRTDRPTAVHQGGAECFSRVYCICNCNCDPSWIEGYEE